MTILFADQFSDPGGAQLCLMDLLPGVLERGWKPVVMAPGSGLLVKWCAANDIPFESLPLPLYSSGHKTVSDALRFPFDRARTRAAIRGVVKENACDLVYVNGPRVLPAITGLGIPVLFHSHSVIGGRMSRFIASCVIKRERIPVIAVSRFVANQFAGQNVDVIYNGVADCAGERRQTGRELHVGILGRIAPEKGHLDFIRAARLLRAAGSGARFEIFGEALFSGRSYERAVKAAAKDLPVTFHGWQEPRTALGEIDILAVPSGVSEGAGRVVVEAFSAGVPVIAYPVGGIPELIDNGRTGILTDDRTPESLATAILALTMQPELRRRIADAARSEWRKRFTVEEFRRRICDRLERHPYPSLREKAIR